MREILFRGKRIDNGEWVYGAFCPKSCDDPFGPMLDKPSIIKLDEPCDGWWFDVDPSTVGQNTGLTDKNGKRIFEGDVVRFKWDMDCEYCHIIEFVDGEFCATPVLSLENLWSIRICGENKKFTVIGNIHDNPELLKED